MASTAKLIETHSNGAEICHGAVPTCKEKIQKLLEEFSVPPCLMKMEEVEEVGFNRSRGFLWLKQKKKTEHKFPSVGTVVYDVMITAFINQKHLTKVTGIKSKELFLQIAIGDVVVGVPSSDKIKFTTSAGLSRAYPISAFEPQGGS